MKNCLRQRDLPGATALLLLILLSACTPEEPPLNQLEVDRFTAYSEQGHFRVKLTPPSDPLPFQELFDLTLHVEESESGTAVEDAAITVRLRVAHATPVLPTAPRPRPAGAGTYHIEGLLLHVPQRWELRLQIETASHLDEVRFDLGTVGQYAGPLPEGAARDLFSEQELRHILTMSPAPPPPPDPTNAVADNDDAARLGQFLFFEERFSKDGSVSCASCHLPDHGFSDPDALSMGLSTTARRSMPSLNAAYQRWTFWDGRTDSLWAQALQPIEDEAEHGISRTGLVRRLFEDGELKTAFEEIFEALPEMSDRARFPEEARPVPDDPGHPHHQAWLTMSAADQAAVNLAFANFGKALAAYQRRLVRNDSALDHFVLALREDDAAGLQHLSEEAQQGLRLFVGKARCVDCHGGHQLSNFEFHNLGLEQRPWLAETPDTGRSQGLLSLLANTDFNARGPLSDAADSPAAQRLEFLPAPDFLLDGAFKTPTLRNVAERAPYMHGGHLNTLEEVVDFYSDLQEDPPLGLRDPLLQQVNLSAAETRALVAFLEHLTGAPLPEHLSTPLPSAKP